MLEPVRHLEVEFAMLPTQKCGRRAPIFTGFRGTFHYNERDWEASPVLEEQMEFLFPGETTVLHISFLTAKQDQIGRLRPGAVFQFSDDRRVIAHGTVRRLVERALDGQIQPG